MSAPEKHPVKTRIVVLEEHPLLRHGIAHLLNSKEDMIVCGETDNIRDARHKIQESKPHLLLTALRLGTGDSLEFLKALKSERPDLLILVYSAFEETIFAERAFRAGAEGYVMKKAPKEELVTAIRENRWRPDKNNNNNNNARRVLRLALKNCPIARCTSSFC